MLHDKKISGTVSVNIERNGTSQVGTSLQLVCQVGNTPTLPIGAVVYEWTSTCSGGCFVLGQSRAATVGTQYLKAVDSGRHTCTVTDSVGNRGSASVNITTTGEGVWCIHCLLCHPCGCSVTIFLS